MVNRLFGICYQLMKREKIPARNWQKDMKYPYAPFTGMWKCSVWQESLFLPVREEAAAFP